MRYIIRLFTAACCAIGAFGAGPAQAEKRVALVIGNADYKVGPLQNPVSDATAVAEAFGKLGFDKVILRKNLGFEAFRAALRDIAREARGAELGAVYFAGHGTEVGGRNFLIPIDATLATAGDLSLEAISLDTVLDQLSGVTRLKLVILDACRNNLFPVAGGKRNVTRGLSRIEPEDNTLVIYAAKDGTTADDGVGRKNSPFTEALLKHIATPGLEINFVFRRVRDDVVAATNPVQYPHVYGTLGGKEFYLKPPATAPTPPVVTPVRPSEAAEAWATAKDTTSVPMLEAFIRRFGDTYYGDLAKVRLAELKQAERSRQTAEATKKAEGELRAKTEAERERLAMLQQEVERKRAEAAKKSADANKGGKITTRTFSWASISSASACEASCRSNAPRCLGWRYGNDSVCKLYEDDAPSDSKRSAEGRIRQPVEGEKPQQVAAAKGGKITTRAFSWASISSATTCEASCRSNAPRCLGWRYGDDSVCKLYEDDAN